jgi:hypothetical protein
VAFRKLGSNSRAPFLRINEALKNKKKPFS